LYSDNSNFIVTVSRVKSRYCYKTYVVLYANRVYSGRDVNKDKVNKNRIY